MAGLLLHALLPAAAVDTTSPGVGTSPSMVTLSLSQYQQLFTQSFLASAEAEHRDTRRALEQEYQEQRDAMRVTREQLEGEARAGRDASSASATEDLRQLFPTNYQLLNHTVDGSFNVTASRESAEADVAAFRVVSTLRVLGDVWTVVPLANASSIIASEWRLEWRQDLQDGCDASASASEPPGNATTAAAAASAPAPGWQPVDPETDARALLLLRGEQHALVTNRSGLYRASFVAHARVRKARHCMCLE